MIKTSSILSFTLISTLVAGSFSARAGGIDYEKTETMTLATESVNQFEIEAKAGFLKIVGEESRQAIEVVAEIAVEQDNYKLVLEQKGSRAVLIADANPGNSARWFGESPKIDLTIKMPKQLALDIQDGSGFIELENLGGLLQIEDGSGYIKAKDILADIKIDDGSGNIDLSNVKGKVKIHDGSGGIEISNVGESVEIKDGSGRIELSEIGGKVELDDGSGDLSVKNAKGHVTIDDGSGDITVESLKGGLTVLNAGSGRLSMKNVEGEINTKD